MREKRKRTRERKKRCLFWKMEAGQRTVSHREDTDMAHRQTTVYKVKGETLYSDEMLNFNWVC